MFEVSNLDKRLAELEEKRLFNGESYPIELVPFPHRLIGRGFYPGGDGIWRDTSRVDQPASVPFPKGGVLILGQDFGSIDSYPPFSRSFELPSVLTWKYLIPRLEAAEIPLREVFFSNGLLGLRRSGSNDGKNPAIDNSVFVGMCREFLEFQIKTQEPRLIIVFDSLSPLVYGHVFEHASRDTSNSRISTGTILGKIRVLATTQHPRSDCGVINKSKSNYEDRCNTLRRAWLLASRVA